jgi:protein-S-isoprenylcysteine O-methyltransferase Ste14
MQLFAWLGGGLFIAALADAAYAYLVRWSIVVRFRGAVAIATDVTLFTMFALHHSVFARDSVKAIVRLLVDDRWIRSLYVWIASVLLIVTLELWAPIGGEVYRVGGIGAVALAVIQLLGLLLIARSVSAIDPLELAGIRSPQTPSPLSVRGPYRLVRHPLYLGWVLVVFGAAHLTGDRLAFAAITTTYLVIAIPWEERSLLHVYGEQYARYSHTVRWRLVPYIY